MSNIDHYTSIEHKAFAARFHDIEASLLALADSFNLDGHRIPVAYVDRILALRQTVRKNRLAFRKLMAKHCNIGQGQDWYYDP